MLGHFTGGPERPWFGELDYTGDSKQEAVSHIAPNIPESVYAMLQLTFVIITAALVIVSFVERMRFSVILIFIAMWTVVVYAPIARWIWASNGWLAGAGLLWRAGLVSTPVLPQRPMGVHGISGIVGSLPTGVFASKTISRVEGRVLIQFVGAAFVMIYSLVMTSLLLWLTSRFVSLHVSEKAESDGLDIDQHAEPFGA